jgi:hypothetical protein
MKKLNKLLLLVFTFVLFPIQAHACPHVDEEGNKHFQFYNEDYTEMTKMYPKDGYLYNKNVYIDTEELISEDFGFPLIQDKETYMQNYYFIDYRTQSEDWDTIEIKTTVEGLESMTVEGTGYKLKVGLENTFNNSRKYQNDKLLQMYYNVFIKDINNNKDNEKYSNIASRIEANNLELIIPNILEIDTEYFTMNTLENNYETENIIIDELYDNIEVTIPNANSNENVVAININNVIDPSKTLECIYDNNEKAYKFKIEEAGTYIIVKNNVEAEKIEEGTITLDGYSSRNLEISTKTIIIIAAIAIGIFLIIFILAKLKK